MSPHLAQLSFLFLFFSAVGPVVALDIVAHRGASHDAPENTVASARLGWEQNADAVEIDIHLSKDGHIVVMHDADTKRTTGQPGKIVEQDWADLRALEAGAWKGDRWRGEKIPDLDEVLATVPRGKRLFIEIKCGPEILPALDQSLRKSALKPEQLVIIGFGYDTVVAAKARFPKLEVYWLSSFKKDQQTGAVTPTIDTLIEKARAARLDGLDLQHQGPIDAAAVQKVKAAGLECHVWTVDDPEVARRMKAAGVDSITTNRPQYLRDQLAAP